MYNTMQYGSRDFGGGLGSFFGYGGYQQPMPTPFHAGDFAKSLGMSQEDRQQFVQDLQSGSINLNELFGSPMQGGENMFDSNAPIEKRVGNLEQAVQRGIQQPMQQPMGMMPGYGQGIMPFANYGIAQPQLMGF